MIQCVLFLGCTEDALCCCDANEKRKTRGTVELPLPDERKLSDHEEVIPPPPLLPPHLAADDEGQFLQLCR